MKNCILLICTLLSLNIAAQNCTPFLPTSVGSTWEITSYNTKDKIEGKTAYELLETTSDGDNISFKIKAVNYDKKGEELASNTFEAACKEGKFHFDMEFAIDASMMDAYKNMDVDIDATDLELPNIETAVVGSTLPDGTLTMTVSNSTMSIGTFTVNTVNRKVEAREKYVSPAGEFDCVVISQTNQTKMMIKIETSSKEWYAEGVGIVRSEFYNKKGTLKGYSLLTALTVK